VSDRRRAPGLSAEDVFAAVRVHADRVHDFVRRLGCSGPAAAEVVETSALDLVDAVATRPESVPDVVGWWFGRARALGRSVAGAVAGTSPELPLGGGLLSADEDQALVAEALDVLPERDRVALLLRDSYALPAVSVGVALGADVEMGMELVGRARLAFLAGIGDDEVRPTAGHAVQLGALARLAEGGPVAAADATARRHAQACQICRSVLDAEARAHSMLAGLAVVALPERVREEVLAHVEAQAQAYLPSAADLMLDDDEVLDEEPSRWAVPLYALAALVAAVVVGTVIGLLLSRSPSGSGSSSAGPVDPGVLPPVTAKPLPPTSPLPTAFPSLAGQPTPTVFIVTPPPSPTAGPSRAGSTGPSGPPEPATEPLTLMVNPASGPNGATLSVEGTGWTAGRTITLDYLDPLGRQTGSHAGAVSDVRGRFTTTLSAQDPSNLPGRHTVRCTDGTHTATASYTVNG
jgi:DNA-directed RNA polymerase specialized sigma24 family protein